MNGQGYTNGWHHQGDDGGQASARPRPSLRVPTVHEALPYTPFSSIIPFNAADTIPPPVALPTTSSTYFQDLPEVTSTAKVLQRLSQGANSAEQAGNRCQQTVRDMQKLLAPESLSQFKFKYPDRPNTNISKGANQQRVRAPELSPFVRMVLDNTRVSFRYLTPESPDLLVKADTNGAKVSAKVVLPTPQSRLKSTPNAAPPLSTPQSQPPIGSPESRVVIMPKILTPAQRAEYHWVPEDSSVSILHNKTPSKIRENRVAGDHRPMSVDQQQKSELAVQKLKSLLSEIFDAEDHLQPDTSGMVSATAHALLALQKTDEGSRAVLQPETQVRLESAALKVVASGRLESIGLEELIHVEKLCEVAVAEVETTSLHIGEEWSEHDAEEWNQRLVIAERSMIAGRTLMRIMGAGAHIKELQSEDCLRSVLTATKTVLENLLVPMAELRYSTHEKIRGTKEEPPADSRFLIAQAQRAVLQTTLHAIVKTLRVLGDFLIKTDVDESSLSVVEAFCILLIFADNASNDRDSVFGVQNVETARRSTMDILAKVFAKYTSQRQWIVDALLTSLDKLPATKQNARQYRLPDAKPIQLVSALLMRLVQTCATHPGEATRGKSKALEDDAEDDADEEDADGEDKEEEDDDRGKLSPTKCRNQSKDLVTLVKPLHDDAQTYASYIVRSLLNRALASSKSSDEPYRKLLDIFTEDFLNVLGSSDWPAAEMILRALVLLMVNVIEDLKYPVPARTLALEILGTIASGMIELRLAASKMARSLETGDSDIGSTLLRFVDQLEADESDTTSLLAFGGPYCMVVEYLQARNLEDAQLRSAHGYYLMQWAMHVCGGRESSVASDASGSVDTPKQLDALLRHMVIDHKWLEEHHDYARPTTTEGRLAAVVVTLSSKLCKAFNRISNVLLTAMSSEQARVQSRALKSVTMLLEKNPSLLDRNATVFSHVTRCLGEPSPLVRESAIMLVADCVKMRPALVKSVYDRIIDRTRDTSATVRKRAIKLLKDFYLGTESTKIRSAIADAVIARISDMEESVTKLARHIVDDIWFIPFLGQKLDGDGAIANRLRYGEQACLLIQTVEASDDTAVTLETLIRQLITSGEAPQAHAAVCRNLIRVLSDGIVDNTDLPSKPEQPDILLCLALFARAGPKLFTAAQLERLEPFTQNLSSTEDLEVFRAAVSILRHVLPHQATLKDLFLQNLQLSLLGSISKLPKAELKEAVPCVWTITQLLGNRERIFRFAASALKNLNDMRSAQFDADERLVVKAAKLMLIVGNFGRVCDFEEFLGLIKSILPWYKGSTVSGAFVEVLCPFTSLKQLLRLRQLALDALCMVCQASPKMLLRQDVVTAFDIVFRDRDTAVEEILLTGLDIFFSAGEVSEGTANIPELGSGAASGTDRLGKTYVATDQDGASTSIARRFIPQILHIALSSQGEAAFVASKIIVSVNRQGLVHPKESGPALVALETCPDSAIANMAFAEHKAQHSKHESLFDKEYMRAFQQAYEYQRDVVHSVTGYIGQPPVSKLNLLWEVLKSGKAQVRKKFLSNLAAKLDFDMAGQGAAGRLSAHLGFVRFAAENLALFDYERVEELLQLLAALDKTFAATGSTIAQAIESEVLHLRMDTVAGSSPGPAILSDTMQAEASIEAVDTERLLQLSLAAQICSVIWETRSFIRRLWNLQKYLNKPKNTAKESNRTASRATNAQSLTELYLKRIATLTNTDGSQETQRFVCASFVELMSVDNEVKVNTEEEDDAVRESGYETPSEGTSGKSPSLPPSGGGGQGKKRKSVSVSGTPRKRGRPNMTKRKSTAIKLDEEDADGGWD
ncbi:Sister chromatid cohesion protein 2 [Recurvomyces mirabilis]|nr:Sister chromatid cohesion protein 2 [Recurvomyces mirabilis]